jgi:hypothetical protein
MISINLAMMKIFPESRGESKEHIIFSQRDKIYSGEQSANGGRVI